MAPVLRNFFIFAFISNAKRKGGATLLHKIYIRDNPLMMESSSPKKYVVHLAPYIGNKERGPFLCHTNGAQKAM